MPPRIHYAWRRESVHVARVCARMDANGRKWAQMGANGAPGAVGLKRRRPARRQWDNGSKAMTRIEAHDAARRHWLAAGCGTLALAWLGLARPARAGTIAIGASSALIVVDVQNCFMPGGTLPVNHGDEVVPVINRLAARFGCVVTTQDWHTPGHVSFASAHPGSKPFDSIKLKYGRQVLWPDHCIQGTHDAELHPDLVVAPAQLVIRKGFHPDVDSYSAFVEADRRTTTGLAGYLRARGIKTLFVAGLATDFCVAWTALDARAAGFQVYVVEDACRAIDLNGSLAAAWKQMLAHGAHRIQSADVT